MHGGHCNCGKDGQPEFDHEHTSCKGCLEHKKKHLEEKLEWVNDQLKKVEEK